MFFFDWTYLLIVLPVALIAFWASANVQSTFARYSRQFNRRRMTGAEAARIVLDQNGLRHIRIERVQGSLTDHYDPRQETIFLSETVYDRATSAAVGVAAHEAGHAIQHATGYLPIRLRSAIIPITNIGSRLAFPLILIGILLSAFGEVFAVIAYIGIGCYALTAVFQLVTLPTEFNASRRALAAIENTQLLYEDEVKGTRRVLRAAALTYVAALAVSLAQILRLFIIVRGNDRR